MKIRFIIICLLSLSSLYSSDNFNNYKYTSSQNLFVRNNVRYKFDRITKGKNYIFKRNQLYKKNSINYLNENEKDISFKRGIFLILSGVTAGLGYSYAGSRIGYIIDSKDGDEEFNGITGAIIGGIIGYDVGSASGVYLASKFLGVKNNKILYIRCLFGSSIGTIISLSGIVIFHDYPFMLPLALLAPATLATISIYF